MSAMTTPGRSAANRAVASGVTGDRSREVAVELVLPFRRHERHRSSDDLFFVPAEDPLRGRAPAHDMPVDVRGNHAERRRFDDRMQRRVGRARRLFGPLEPPERLGVCDQLFRMSRDGSRRV